MKYLVPSIHEMPIYFTHPEMVRSTTALNEGIDNEPKTQDLLDNGSHLIRALTEIREAVGRMIVTSGYRCAELNSRVGGSATSMHMLYLAADTMSGGGMPIRTYFSRMVDYLNSHPFVSFHTCIIEYDSWVHFDMAPIGSVGMRRFQLIKRNKDTGLNEKWKIHASQDVELQVAHLYG